MKDYILFIPPEEVSAIKARLWTTKQAKTYFDWLMSVKDDRVDYLLTCIDESLTGDHKNDIERVSKKITYILKKPVFSELKEGDAIITNRGLAIVADLSLLISKLIINTHPQLKWKIVKQPKRDISYNLPALFEFPIIRHIELMGGCIAEAKAILRGEKSESIWLEIYEYATGLIK
ncbi:hypothetical protein LT679_17410 [Mucilaginibacter roseus]|uniref:Uncharacterized protein n=1 Tax=Mucilaginibacter roseus TaxID=1528868 RepID=A0ABS8U7M0_9SPHI|nr:hypothetical protein [Mucilaginibacter roseus]MCD8742392.1 hypothetical protein [Mucilaginibacter roseus]